MTPEAIRHLKKSDKVLKSLIEKVGPFNLKPQKKQETHEALIEAVAYQQLTGKAAATIFNRFLALYPDSKFPPPEKVARTTVAKLRSAGLSNAKCLSIRDIAKKTLDGVVPNAREIVKLSDDEIIERLTSIRGVGPWTVEMLLIFKLGRPDVFPSTDYGIRKGYALVYKKKALPKPKQLLLLTEKWKPYRTTAAWYLWRALD